MRYQGIFLLILGVIIALFLSQQDFFYHFIGSLGSMGYLGSFLLGIFFVSSISVATSILGLLQLAEIQNIALIAISAGIGAVIGDLVIFKFVRDNLNQDLKSLFDKIPSIRRRHMIRLFETKYLAWFLPFAGGVIIASPLPDELGVSLMGISKISKFRFVLISFILNTLGIYLMLKIGK